MARVRKSAAQRRGELLKSARSLIVERGFAAVQVQDLLDATGLSRGGFYHHFGSLRVVLDALVLEETRALLERVVRGRAITADSIAELVRLGSMAADADGGVLDAIEREDDRVAYLDSLAAAHSLLLRPLLIEAIDEGVRTGRFRALEAAHVAELFLAVNAHINRQRIGGRWSVAETRAFAATALFAMERLLGVSEFFASPEEA